MRIKELVRLAEDHGFTVDRTKRGHYRFRDPSGRIVSMDAGTPSEYRGRKNTIARLRRAGLPIPHKGK